MRIFGINRFSKGGDAYRFDQALLEGMSVWLIFPFNPTGEEYEKNTRFNYQRYDDAVAGSSKHTNCTESK